MDSYLYDVQARRYVLIILTGNLNHNYNYFILWLAVTVHYCPWRDMTLPALATQPFIDNSKQCANNYFANLCGQGQPGLTPPLTYQWQSSQLSSP